MHVTLSEEVHNQIHVFHDFLKKHKRLRICHITKRYNTLLQITEFTKKRVYTNIRRVPGSYERRTELLHYRSNETAIILYTS